MTVLLIRHNKSKFFRKKLPFVNGFAEWRHELLGLGEGIQSCDQYAQVEGGRNPEYLKRIIRSTNREQIKPSRCTDSIGGHDDLDILCRLEPIKLVQQLQHCPLDFRVTTSASTFSS